MRSRYHPDGSIEYDADRALEILRYADEELARRQLAQQEEALRMTAAAHAEPDMTAKKPAMATACAKTAFPGMPEDPLEAFMNPSLMDLVSNPFPTTPPMTATPSTHSNLTKP